MKPRYLIIAAAILVVAAAMILLPKNRDSASSAPPVVAYTPSDGMKLATVTDPTLVFQKAFWRRPAEDDKILHAERREWSTTEDGVRKWQWFLAVDPGPQFLEWLQTNPFSLAAAKSGADLTHKPDWFPKPSGDFTVQKNAGGRFMLMLSPDQKHLFVTDSGEGFGAPAVVE